MDHPEESIGAYACVEIVQSCPRTGVKEVNSYFDERALRVRAVGRNVLAAVEADVGLGDIRAAMVIRRNRCRAPAGTDG